MQNYFEIRLSTLRVFKIDDHRTDRNGQNNLLLFIKSMEVEFEIKSNLPARKCGRRWMTRKIREKIQKERKVERAWKIGFIR